MRFSSSNQAFVWGTKRAPALPCPIHGFLFLGYLPWVKWRTKGRSEKVANERCWSTTLIMKRNKVIHKKGRALMLKARSWMGSGISLAKAKLWRGCEAFKNGQQLVHGLPHALYQHWIWLLHYGLSKKRKKILFWRISWWLSRLRGFRAKNNQTGTKILALRLTGSVTNMFIYFRTLTYSTYFPAIVCIMWSILRTRAKLLWRSVQLSLLRTKPLLFRGRRMPTSGRIQFH